MFIEPEKAKIKKKYLLTLTNGLKSYPKKFCYVAKLNKINLSFKLGSAYALEILRP